MPDAIDTLSAMGFEPDLGPSMTLELKDGTTIIVAGLSSEGEADFLEDGKRAMVQWLRDSWDHSTMIREEVFDTADIAVAAAKEWIGL